MTEKTTWRKSIEGLAVGASIFMPCGNNAAAYRRANNITQRVSLASARLKTFRLKRMAKSICITRLT